MCCALHRSVENEFLGRFRRVSPCVCARRVPGESFGFLQVSECRPWGEGLKLSPPRKWIAGK